MMLLPALENAISEKKNIYLYGAGIVACEALKAIDFLYHVSICACVVTKKDGNKDSLCGVSIRELSSIEDDNAWFLVTAPEQYHAEIKKEMEGRGFFHYSFFDSDMEYALMGQYLKKKYNLKLIEDFAQDKRTVKDDDAFIGMATSIYDKKLATAYSEPAWVKKVQAGTALTDQRIATYSDDIGDSISGENPVYGELTVTYFMWKNISQKVMGLYHYRRVLDIDEEAINLLLQGDADVILPLPYVCENVTRDQFGRYLSDEDIDIMLDVLKEDHADSFGLITEALKSERLYNYNILVAREEVFKDYCNWLFPLLEKMYQRGKDIDTSFRLTRHVGRIGEVLTSIYFSVNEKNWNVVHAKKIWRV